MGAQPYVGEIILFAGNFAPAGWVPCHGQLLSIVENDTLFTLIGTTYGGDGQNTFALPDLRGRVPIHAGQGAGLQPRFFAEVGGEELVRLSQGTIPLHTHTAGAANAVGNSAAAEGAIPAQSTGGRSYRSGEANAAMSAGALNPAGGGQGHNNLQPSTGLNYIICLFGIFPTQA